MPTITVTLPATLKLFEVPPSDIEVITTRSFVKAGLESNRFNALFKAIGAIVASGVMVVKNPVDGAITGTTLILQGDISQGATEIASGAFNSARSLYNVFVVFTTALFGLLPYLNPIMYSAIEITDTRAEQLQRELDSAKLSTQNKETILSSYKNDLEKFKEIITKLLQQQQSQQPLNVDTNSKFESNLMEVLSPSLTLINNLVNAIPKTPSSATPVPLSGLKVPVKDQQFTKELTTFIPYFNNLSQDLESLSIYMGQLNTKKPRISLPTPINSVLSTTSAPSLGAKNTHSQLKTKAAISKPVFNSAWKDLFSGVVIYLDNLKKQSKQLTTNHKTAINLLNQEIEELKLKVGKLERLNQE